MATKDGIVGWQYRFNGHEFEQTPGDSKRQGSLVCCSPWGQKELDTIYQLNDNNIYGFIFGCAGSSLLHADFLQLQPAGATL